MTEHRIASQQAGMPGFSLLCSSNCCSVWQCPHPSFPCLPPCGKNTSPHVRRICLSAIFSKHLIFYRANCTYFVICSCDTVMTCKAPLWVPSYLHESSHGIQLLRSTSSFPDLNCSQHLAFTRQESLAAARCRSWTAVVC